ncbi:MAG: MBOAT family protein [Clostridia bacterium]|nr:MBOAT family protein [Clostridia bacterium]
MVFSSISFLYYFLPIVLILYFLVPKKAKNFVLFIASITFYFYGEKAYTVIMLAQILLAYISGILIDKYKGTKQAKTVMSVAVMLCLGVLGYFKYTNFLILNINNLLKTSISILEVMLPIGISFYTFQIISYIVDVYRGKAEVQKSFLKLATYVSLFPQLIAGPIVRYVDVERELTNRKITLEGVSSGVTRFTIGLGKKVLLANSLAKLCDIFKLSDEKSVLFFWIYGIACTLYVYLDFSGYSDMAIGIGRMLGFNFLENFNYPFISKSITEFWRRWHMSLGSWFRDYVYIPLGGNRVSKLKFIRNILVVWGLTGLWHGADWNFILWGLMFGVLLLLEKLVLKKYLEKLPAIFSNLYVMLIIVISFVIFNSNGMEEVVFYLSGMFGGLDVPVINNTTMYYLRSYIVTIVIAIIASTPLIKNAVIRLKEKRRINKIINVLEPIFVVCLLIATTSYLVDDSFNPFLYFRF